MLGRKLQLGHVVHHKNRDKTDNRRKDLWVIESQEKDHHILEQDEKRTGQW